MGVSPNKILDFDLALATVLEHSLKMLPPETEHVELLVSVRRILAAEIKADRDQPPFNRSSRDGFAVRTADFASSHTAQIQGRVLAGEVWKQGEIKPGGAVEIMTGAPVPEGLDSVVMVEHVIRSGDEIRIEELRTIKAGENIVARGTEAKADSPVVGQGAAIGAAEIALAAACGYSRLEVFCRPKVAIIATGDELVAVAAQPKPWQIRNSNGYAVQAMVEAAGGIADRLEVARDIRDEIRERIMEGRKADLLTLSGGVSMGEHDLVEEVLEELGAEFFFTGVKMQPGKPVVFGRLPEQKEAKACYFFGLPGNPISTQVTFHCFVEPFLRAMCGANTLGPNFVQATLAEKIAGKSGLTRVLPAQLTCDRAKPEVRIVDWKGSGDQAANARANCYVVLPDGAEQFSAGDIVTVLLRS